MAKIKFNGLVDNVSGSVGGVVVRKRKGKFTLANKPDFSEVVPSEAQAAQRKVFGEAVDYGKRVMANPQSWAFYQGLAAQKDIPVFSLCMADFLNPPSMDDLDLSKYQGKVGDQILITTHDDVGVVNVSVELVKSDGTHIEKGNAVDLGGGAWAYVATVAVPAGTDIFIEAEGFDRPGSRVVASANPIVGS